MDKKYALKIQIIDKYNTSQRQQSKPLRKNANNREKMQVSDKKKCNSSINLYLEI